MDHLPFPIDGDGVHLAVHCYTESRTFSPDEFFNIPRQYGYPDIRTLLEVGLNAGMDPEKANQFLQTWLFFGLLAEVLRRIIHTDDFINAISHTICTQKLNTFLAEWIEREKQEVDVESAKKREAYTRVSWALEYARKFVSKHCSHQHIDIDGRPFHQPVVRWQKPQNPTLDKLDDKMTLSLAILGETLQRERPKMAPAVEDRIHFWMKPEELETNWGFSKYLRREMKEKGMCPHEVRRLESTMRGVNILYYARLTKTWRGQGDHSMCSIAECTSPKEFPGPLHRCGDRSCLPFGFDEENIAKIIERGETPLIEVTRKGSIVMRPVDLSGPQVPDFGALSHSWEDGIVYCGQDARGKNDRKMLECQIESLKRTFGELLKGQKTIFWIDVLCFPRAAKARAAAINQLKHIYSRAKVVLVWDRNLLQRPRSWDVIGMNVRIKSGDWARRLWTLQEAVLAENLCVEFKDGVVCVEELDQARDEAMRNLDNSHHHVRRAGHPFSEAVSRLRRPDDEYPVQRAWEAVQFRSNHEPRDETIILANILGLDVNEILKVDEVNVDPEMVSCLRMVKFLDLLDETPRLGIPAGIIFLPLPKLPIPGYGWAPSTWMSEQTFSNPLYRAPKRAASVMRRGLLVQFPGLLLHWPETPVDWRIFWVPVHQSLRTWYKVVTDVPSDQWSEFSRQVSTHTEPSIILSVKNPGERWEAGVLVRAKGKLAQGEIRWVDILCRVWVRLETNSNITQELEKKILESQNYMFIGEFLSESQKWCVQGNIDAVETES